MRVKLTLAQKRALKLFRGREDEIMVGYASGIPSGWSVMSALAKMGLVRCTATHTVRRCRRGGIGGKAIGSQAYYMLTEAGAEHVATGDARR